MDRSIIFRSGIVALVINLLYYFTVTNRKYDFISLFNIGLLIVVFVFLTVILYLEKRYVKK